MDTLSPALCLVTFLWEGTCEALPHSWERVHDSMRRALHLAISAGLRFDCNDFAVIARSFRWGYWCGTDTSKNSGEQFYTAAVECGNLHACRAMEKWWGRTPFFVNGARLRLGSSFPWDGHVVFVTSFDDEAGTLTACAYDQLGWSAVLPYGITHEREARGKGKPRKRYTITATMLRMLSRVQQHAAGADEKEEKC